MLKNQDIIITPIPIPKSKKQTKKPKKQPKKQDFGDEIPDDRLVALMEQKPKQRGTERQKWEDQMRALKKQVATERRKTRPPTDWQLFLKEYRANNPGISLKQAMSEASEIFGERKLNEAIRQRRLQEQPELIQPQGLIPTQVADEIMEDEMLASQPSRKRQRKSKKQVASGAGNLKGLYTVGKRVLW